VGDRILERIRRRPDAMASFSQQPGYGFRVHKHARARNHRAARRDATRRDSSSTAVSRVAVLPMDRGPNCVPPWSAQSRAAQQAAPPRTRPESRVRGSRGQNQGKTPAGGSVPSFGGSLTPSPGGHWPSCTPRQHSSGMSSRRSRPGDASGMSFLPSFDRFIDPLVRRSLAQYRARATLQRDVLPSPDRFIDPFAKGSLAREPHLPQ
jgi:hypothetical protein